MFGREPGTLRNIYASGGVGFLHDLVELAGGRNVFAAVRRESLQASTETIIAAAPEVIIELRYGTSVVPGRLDAERDSWLALASVPAVRDRRVHLLVGDELWCRARAWPPPPSDSRRPSTPACRHAPPIQITDASATRRRCQNLATVSLTVIACDAGDNRRQPCVWRAGHR